MAQTAYEAIVSSIDQLEGNIAEIDEAHIRALSAEEVQALIERYGTTTLLRLPESEQRFFHWLKEHDRAVYDDLWGEDEDLVVTFAHLDALRKGDHGIVICDLESEANYFFTFKHLKPHGLKTANFVLAMAESNKELSIGEALLFEIMVGPIDIWHFAYKYNVPLERAKKAVDLLCEHEILVHLTDRESLVRYLELEEE